MTKFIRHLICWILIGWFVNFSEGAIEAKTYEIWEPEPAPNRGSSLKKGADWQGKPFDQDWEAWSYPLGNGYMGANIFGRLDTERIQITEKTLHNEGLWGLGGLTSFIELYLDFNHSNARDYRRSLNINEAIAYVSYTKDGVAYKREYFMSYPDNVMAVKLTADRKGALSFVVRPEIPYCDNKGRRSGKVTAQGNLLAFGGTISHFNCNYEGQLLVINEGGSTQPDENKGTIMVQNADSVVLLMAAGTNYELSEKIFTSPNNRKLDASVFPHEKVSKLIKSAQATGYETLKQRHLKDYQNLFSRVAVNLNTEVSPDPTHTVLDNYKKGSRSPWLEELMFQYGRYLLIASSREKSLPSGLQGAWSQYDITPWTGGYWHNINVQMNYWGVMSANLAECFEAYIAYCKAYMPKARQHASNYVKSHKKAGADEGDGDDGWIIGTSATAYVVGGPGGHSGPGTGGFTTKLLVDYYHFTKDEKFLADFGYPAVSSMSRFLSKALVPHGDLLLVEPSASPEQKVNGKHYNTVGCAFDQGFVWENHQDTLQLAVVLGKEDAFLHKLRDEVKKLDPIQVGASGQIKEFREESAYGEIGEKDHRHISHLCALYPGTLVGPGKEEWEKAAAKTLDLRGNNTTGWALAHRMNCRARLRQGNQALEVYEKFIRERTAPNLWTMHPPFQIDGSLGTMAGVAEMLLQSHQEYIEILPALPESWNTGSFSGLVARGNFAVSAEWKNGKATRLAVNARSSGQCKIAYPDIGAAQVKNSDGTLINPSEKVQNQITITAAVGETYHILISEIDRK